MRFYPFTIPKWIDRIYTNLVWRMPSDNKKVIYLTFDDGPHPEVTHWVMETLAEYNAKATFFVVGENVVKHPATFDAITKNGHQIGNHTYNHYSGYKVGTQTYIENIYACQRLTKNNLFRPPYGRIKQKQAKLLKDFKIIMWSQLSGDFDAGLNQKNSLKNLCNNSKNGNIVVFHDSLKAFENLKFLLPQYLDYLRTNGFVCNPITASDYVVD